tara:strand:- start:308 stop:538 length:231 start_codon:yes stop_codon:yes gene_type:complete
MEKDKLKLIVHNMELLLEALKSEVYSDKEAYAKAAELDADRFDLYGSSQAEDAFSTVVKTESQGYELYDDDDGYAD